MFTVGVDIAKATLEATAVREGHAVRLGTFAQTADGWAALRDAVVGLQRALSASAGGGSADADRELVALVLEPTGGYELAFALWARRQPGWQVHRPNPARVRAWARSQGLRAKTDRQDALLLARFGASAQPARGTSSWESGRMPRRPYGPAWSGCSPPWRTRWPSWSGRLRSRCTAMLRYRPLSSGCAPCRGWARAWHSHSW